MCFFCVFFGNLLKPSGKSEGFGFGIPPFQEWTAHWHVWSSVQVPGFLLEGFLPLMNSIGALLGPGVRLDSRDCNYS